MAADSPLNIAVRGGRGALALPVIAVTMGDPAGIGPEIIAKTLSDIGLQHRARFVVVGSVGVIQEVCSQLRIAQFWGGSTDCGAEATEVSGVATGSGVLIHDVPIDRGALPSKPDHSREGGRASFECVELAISMVKAPIDAPMHADAIVTAPISKTSWDMARRAAAGSSDEAKFGPIARGFPGHTELLASRFGSERCAMLFAGPSLRVILATIHVPLMAVGAALSTRLVLDTIVLAARACEQLGVAKPRIAVCGLNPHAGEGGLLGAEDRAIISPAIASAIAKGLDATGPHPADTIFHKALMTDGRRRDATNGYDCVVAMYHDQGLIPVKLADPRSTVNVTVGLEWQGRPVIRTSPAHGTAFDIAGRNLADPASMLSAIELALEMIDQRCAREATRDGRATTGGALHS